MSYIHPDVITTPGIKRAALMTASRKLQEVFELLAAAHQASGEGKHLADAAWDLIDALEDAI